MAKTQGAAGHEDSGNSSDGREAAIIRERRKSLHMTQIQVATEVGIELRQYQKYEYGVAKLSNATMKMGLRICAALELDPFETVFESGEDLAGVEKKVKKPAPKHLKP